MQRHRLNYLQKNPQHCRGLDRIPTSLFVKIELMTSECDVQIRNNQYFVFFTFKVGQALLKEK